MHVLVTGASGFVGTRLVPRIREHGHSVTSVAWSPSGERLATGSNDGFARVFDVGISRARLNWRSEVFFASFGPRPAATEARSTQN